MDPELEAALRAAMAEAGDRVNSSDGRRDAALLLMADLYNCPNIVGNVLSRAFERGWPYVATVLTAVALHGRAFIRDLLGEAQVQLVVTDCDEDSLACLAAHRYAEKMLTATPSEGMALSRSLLNERDEDDAEYLGELSVHMVTVVASVMDTVLNNREKALAEEHSITGETESDSGS